METIQEDVVKEEIGTDFKKNRRPALVVSPVRLREDLIMEESVGCLYGESNVYDLNSRVDPPSHSVPNSAAVVPTATLRSKIGLPASGAPSASSPS